MAVKVENLSDLQQKLRRLPGSVTEVAKDEIQEAGVRIRNRAKANVPVQSGELRKNIRKRREAKGLNAKVSVSGIGGQLFYARFIEFGAKPHTIRPKKGGTKQALADEGFGPVAHVRHPGVTARPFLGPAFTEETRDFRGRLAVAINRELARLAR